MKWHSIQMHDMSTELHLMFYILIFFNIFISSTCGFRKWSLLQTQIKQHILILHENCLWTFGKFTETLLNMIQKYFWYKTKHNEIIKREKNTNTYMITTKTGVVYTKHSQLTTNLTCFQTKGREYTIDRRLLNGNLISFDNGQWKY